MKDDGSMQVATGSWIMQSISQGVNDKDASGDLQNSVQIAGTSNDDVFIVQHIMQEVGVNLPDIRDMAVADRNGQIIAESNNFAEAPDQYHTLLVSNGAKHFIVPGVYIGKRIDAEVDGQPNMNATGDDIKEVEDEDGIIFYGRP